MLKEISCPLFNTPGCPSKKIEFKKGLNVILGTANGDTSIGKTTALLIIDFAFGGKTYAKSDAVRQLGNHVISFIFTFQGLSFHFSRSTETPDDIIFHNSNGNDEHRTLAAYTAWLSKMYNIEYKNISFRDTISRFFRIYGKGNTNEKQPLLAIPLESQEKAIKVVITLFNKYGEIEPYKEQYEEATKTLSTFKAARKYHFISFAVTSQKIYKKNLEEIENYKRLKSEMERQSNGYVSDEELQKANQIDELKRVLYDIRTEINEKKNELHRIELNLKLGIRPTEADLKSLADFFPNVNIEKLMNIEKFHNRIQAILRLELEDSRTKIEKEINCLDVKLHEVQGKMAFIQPSTAYSQEFLDKYSELVSKIKQLEAENTAFDNKKRLEANVKRAKVSLESQTEYVLHSVEKAINKKMEEISDFVSNSENNPPILRINSNRSYKFETPHDDGTATNYRGMLIYDFTMLKLTGLPAIAHDSILFPFASDKEIAKLIELYASEKEKQIFIAFDRYNNFGTATSKRIQDNTVLQLGPDDHALFGRQWGKKK